MARISSIDGYLKVIYTLFLFYQFAYSQIVDNSKPIFKINCIDITRCQNIKKQFGELEKVNDLNPYMVIKLAIKEGKFTFVKMKQNDNQIELDIGFKPTIKSITVKTGQEDEDEILEKSLSLNIGEIFNQEIVEKNKILMKKYLADLGYNNAKISYEILKQNQDVNINYKISMGKPSLLSEIKLNIENKWISEYFNLALADFIGKPFNFNSFKKKVDEVIAVLKDYGHYLAYYDLENKVNDERVTVNLKLNNFELYVFDINENSIIKKREMHQITINTFEKYKNAVDDDKFIDELKNYARDHGYLRPTIKIQRSEYKNSNNINTVKRIIKLRLNDRTKVKGIFFKGNNYFSEKKLLKIFLDNSYDLSSRYIFDEQYYKYFSNLLKEEYLKNGFVQVELSKPNFIFSEDEKSVDIFFNIKEGPRTFVSQIKFDGIDENLSQEIKAKLNNKLNTPFNPLVMDQDITAVSNSLKEKGYYQARIVNLQSDTLLKYSSDFTNVYFKFDIDLGKKIILKKLYVLGNLKTKERIIRNQIDIKEGDIITPSSIRNIISKLNGLGIFKTVTVKPLIDDTLSQQTDVIVTVEERPYIINEIAPGFRTDLGFKVSFKSDVQNLFGKNHTFQFETQANKRISNDALDSRRGKEDGQFLETSHRASYLSRNSFDGLFDNNIGVSYQERRFYSFDARIVRLSETISKDLNNNINTSLRYQFEKISQFDATDSEDEGQLTIGGVTTSFIFDYRNRKVNATSGFFSNFSAEYVSPNFSSDDNIEFYKLITRNNFYYPVTDNFVMAFYVSLGYQKNLAGLDNPIPDIKAFRLTGTDIVRGYDYTEINRLVDGKLLAEADFNSIAHLVNFKIEPRYYVNDSIILGLFYDAGRVFLDEASFSELRSSVGLSFKYLTPVGTLDFDYGVKTLRKTAPDGTLDTPGRIHISIGFF